MPTRIVVFNVVQALGALYALRRGGAPERWTAGMMIAAALLTASLPYDPGVSFREVSQSTLSVDLALLAGLIVLATRANRFWPMWIAALQLLAIAIHVVRGLDPNILPSVYNQTVGKVAYPMIFLLVVGTYRQHRRSVTDDSGHDWSTLKW